MKPGPKPVPLEQRYEVEPESGCWLWKGRTSQGYGETTFAGRTHARAHRVIYELLVGPIPEGLQLDHLCRVRNCVNPAHLEPVTLQENVRRGMGLSALNARKTHCPQGHPYDETNTVVNGQGGRECRICARERVRRYAARKNAETGGAWGRDRQRAFQAKRRGAA